MSVTGKPFYPGKSNIIVWSDMKKNPCSQSNRNLAAITNLTLQQMAHKTLPDHKSNKTFAAITNLTLASIKKK